LAHDILAPQHRLLCYLENVFGRLFFIFIGSRGVAMHDCSSCGLDNDKLNDLLRRTHGLMTVAPTATMNYDGDDENLKFADSFMKDRFREELAEDADRLSDGRMSNLLLEISDLIAEPIAAAENALCSKPLSVFVDFPKKGKMSFLPIDSSQIYAIENGYPSRQYISIDFRQHLLPFISTSKEKIEANILLIGDPSNSLEFSDAEIEFISTSFDKKRIFKLSMDDAIIYSRRKRLMPDIGIVHFIGHHSISYRGDIQSIIPGLSLDITESDFIGVFSYFRAPLNFLSACSTNSTFFTDPSAQKMSLSKRILDLYPCNVVSTLWPITDQAAAYFASCFYQNLVNYNGNPEMSLWASKRAFARGEVFNFPSAPVESSRLGGPAKKKISRITSPASWGAYTLN
jgi:CHAT domain-containing protein